MTPAMSKLALFLFTLGSADHVLGDTLDWVNPAWLLTPAARTDPSMAVARKQVISSAKLKGSSPPWCESSLSPLPLTFMVRLTDDLWISSRNQHNIPRTFRQRTRLPLLGPVPLARLQLVPLLVI